MGDFSDSTKSEHCAESVWGTGDSLPALYSGSVGESGTNSCARGFKGAARSIIATDGWLISNGAGANRLISSNVGASDFELPLRRENPTEPYDDAESIDTR